MYVARLLKNFDREKKCFDKFYRKCCFHIAKEEDTHTFIVAAVNFIQKQLSFFSISNVFSQDLKIFSIFKHYWAEYWELC